MVYYSSKLWYYGTLIYYGNYGTMKKKPWFYTENCDTMDRTMVQCTIARTMELRLTKEKTW